MTQSNQYGGTRKVRRTNEPPESRRRHREGEIGRMGEGADRPISLASLEDFLPPDYRPPHSLQDTLRNLPASDFPGVADVIISSFVPGPRRGEEKSVVNTPLTDDDRLALWAYTFEHAGDLQVVGM